MASYITIPTVVVLFVGYKVYYKTYWLVFFDAGTFVAWLGVNLLCRVHLSFVRDEF